MPESRRTSSATTNFITVFTTNSERGLKIVSGTPCYISSTQNRPWYQQTIITDIHCIQQYCILDVLRQSVYYDQGYYLWFVILLIGVVKYNIRLIISVSMFPRRAISCVITFNHMGNQIHIPLNFLTYCLFLK